ncbi:MAG: (Fe-S)-binding protein [Candidatus Hodarchaeota archaeon]
MPSSGSPSLSSSLNDYAKISRLCSLCNRMCRHSCPTHLITRSDACSPIGRALIIELYRGKKSALTETAVDRLYQCNLCGACKAWCKPRHELPHIIELARERVVMENRVPTGILTFDTEVIRDKNVYGDPSNERFSKLKSLLIQPSATREVVYFIGCTTAYRHPEIALATNEILAKLNIRPKLLTGELGEVCCGSPLLRAGFRDTAKTLAQQNIAAIAQTGIRTVLTTCPGCARALRVDYPRLGVPLPKKIKVYHITEYLTKFQTRLGQLFHNPWAKKKGNLSPKIGYHDPCHLGRELGVYTPPRRLLSLIPGNVLTEFPHNRDLADCCGGGGVLPKTFQALSKAITLSRLKVASELQLDLLVSACPNCKLHFSEVSSQDPDSKLQVLDIVEVLASALR